MKLFNLVLIVIAFFMATFIQPVPAGPTSNNCKELGDRCKVHYHCCSLYCENGVCVDL